MELTGNVPKKAEGGLVGLINEFDKIHSGLCELNTRISSFTELRIGSIPESQVKNSTQEVSQPNSQLSHLRYLANDIHQRLASAHDMITRLESEL